MMTRREIDMLDGTSTRLLGRTVFGTRVWDAGRPGHNLSWDGPGARLHLHRGDQHQDWRYIQLGDDDGAVSEPCPDLAAADREVYRWLAANRRAVAEWPTLAAFHEADPRRLRSREADYGCHWRQAGDWREWRVSYIEDTGEVYAVRFGSRDTAVRVLGVVPRDDDPRNVYYRHVEDVLAGWADHQKSRGFNLAWAEWVLTEYRPDPEDES